MNPRKLYVGFALSAIFLASVSRADTDGTKSGTSFANATVGASSYSWSNTANAGASDGAYATAGPLTSAATYSNYLKVTNFSVNVPSGKVISGIEVVITKSSTNASKTKDYSLKLVKNGVVVGNDNALSASWNSALHTSPTTYGSTTDLWGTTWTADDINSANFGIAYSVTRSGSGGADPTVSIDNIEVRVNYSTPLPVKMVSFTGEVNTGSKQVRLSWTTASEANSDRFAIERSINGASFEEIGSVKGSGNSNGNRDYAFQDENPVEGNSYYRLRQFDYDGKYILSKLVAVEYHPVVSAENKCKFKVYPNPCAGQCNVSLAECDSRQVNVTLVDALGNKVNSDFTLSNDQESFTLDPNNNLKPGDYIVMGSDQNGSFSERVVVPKSGSVPFTVILALMMQLLVLFFSGRIFKR